MLGVDVVAQSELGVEEVEVLVHHIVAVGIIAPAVGRVLHAVVDMTILQVGIAAQALEEGVVGLGIDVEVGLLGVGVVVVEAGQGTLGIAELIEILIA